jgi:hypothetical protein
MLYSKRKLALSIIFASASIAIASAQAPDTAPSTDQKPPKQVDVTDQPDLLANVSAYVSKLMAIKPDRKIIVNGDYVWSSQILAAREIEFKPNSKLVFDNSSANVAGAFFIVADEITIDDPNHPGIVTWKSSVPDTPPDRGQANPGPTGSSPGADGGPGADGSPGAHGTAGADSPDLTVLVRTMAKGGLVIDFEGGPGGNGGIGQKGGEGGPGVQGSPAQQSRRKGPFGETYWLPSCAAGPGHGGNGGTGGAGGPGGDGGKGGRGGNVTLVSLPEHLPTLFTAVRVNVGGGKPGDPGKPGEKGKGGSGGLEGKLANFCNGSHRDGHTGGWGTPGAEGKGGAPGIAGQPFVGSLSNDLFVKLFGF